MTGLYVVLAVLIIVIALAYWQINRALTKHQHAIEWFGKHTVRDDGVKAHEIDPELQDAMDGEDGE